MSDRTAYTVHVTLDRDVTAEDIRKVQEDIEDWSPDDTSDYGSTTSYVLFTQEYEHVVGEEKYVAEAFAEAFPEAVEITVWSDPKYEWMGTIYRLRRGGSKWQMFTADCDAEGNVRVPAYTIRKLLAEAVGSGPVGSYFTLREGLLREIGGQE